MARETGCVVGVDGLPLGTGAAVAIDGVIVSAFELTSDGGRPLDLAQRVDRAIRIGSQRAGRPVAEVRLVLLDDGAAGADLDAITTDVAAGIVVRVVDLADIDASIEAGHDASAHRARSAALDEGSR